MSCFAGAASGDVGSTAIDFFRQLERAGVVALVQRDERQLQKRLAPRGVGVDRLLVPLRRIVRLSLGELHLAQVVEHLARRARALGGLGQRVLGGFQIALFEVRHADADDRLVVFRIGFQQIVVGGDRVVVFLLVAVGGGDLEVDDAERRRLGHDAAIRGDRLVPLLTVVEGISRREVGLQILCGHTAERTAAGGRSAALLQRERERRIRRADCRDLQPARLGREARRLRGERPRTGLQADDREPAFVVGRRGEAARRRARIFGGDRRAFDRLTGFVFHDAADAAGLGRGAAGQRCQTGRDQHASDWMKTVTHARNPLKKPVYIESRESTFRAARARSGRVLGAGAGAASRVNRGILADRAARRSRHRPPRSARRGRPRRPRRHRRVSPRVRPARRRPGCRGDDRRHHLRPRLAHEGRRDDDERDEADGGGANPVERSGGDVHPGVRKVRKGRHHDPPSADAHVGTAAGSRARRRVFRRGGSDSTRGRGSAHVASRRTVHLQRHQLLPARRYRPPRQRPAARSVRQDAGVRSARHEGHGLPAGGAAARADCADRTVPDARLAMRSSTSGDA